MSPRNLKFEVEVSQKIPLRLSEFFHFFQKRLRIFNRFFTHLLHVHMYARLQIFIQLSPTLTKLCHIKRDYLVLIIWSKCPPSTEMLQTFAKLVGIFVDRLLCRVFPDLQQCTFSSGAVLALTEVCKMLEASHPTHGRLFFVGRRT